MYDANIDLNPSPDWLECAGAKVWARTDLPYESIPSFGSSARSKLQQSIPDDEAEMGRLEGSIRRMMLKLRELQDRVGRKRARLAPIRLIPNEILSAIFLDWLSLREKTLGPLQEVYFTPPSTIMEVCRRWAACAISTPSIWTGGTIVINTLFGSPGPVRRYFDRSGSLNLKVYFTRHKEDSQTHNFWSELVLPVLSRIESFTFRGIGIDNTDYPVDEWPDRNFVASLTLCTGLKQLSFYEMRFQESAHQIPIVLPTVRTIEYEVCYGNPPIHCPGLVACKIDQCGLPSTFTHSLATVSPLLERLCLGSSFMDSGGELNDSWPTLHSLKYLDLDCRNAWFTDCYFNSPNICELHIYFSVSIFTQAIEAISLSSFSALTSLTLTMAYPMVGLSAAKVQAMHEWMALAHKIVEFGLIFEQDDKGFYEKKGMNMYIEPLLTTKRDPPCFPRLKHITIGGEVRLKAELFQLLADRATDAQREEACVPACGVSSAIVQRPCLLTLVDSKTLPDMESVGLKEFVDICRTQASVASPDNNEQEVATS